MEIKDFFEKYNIKSEDKLIIACSGGSDSMFLVELTLELHPKENLIIAHFNHNLRGDESLRDEKFVKEYSTKRGLKFVLGNADISEISKRERIGIEEAARNKRYEFLENIRAEYNAKYIFTAHHLDDNIETFIFNLIRGSKLGGLTGIDEKNGYILRPLLNTNKDDILKACEGSQIAFIEDSSNKEDIYLRNHIRLNITPEFKKINPSYRTNIDSTINYFKDLRIHLDSEIIGLLKDDSYFELSEFNKLSNFLQKELIAHIFRIKNNGTIGLTIGNIDEVIRFIGDKGNGTKKDIKHMKLYKKNGKVFF